MVYHRIYSSLEQISRLLRHRHLKDHVPFLYTWNGEEYVFVKDIMWRSALGMPLGIMGGTTAYAFPDASDDYIKIPGESAETQRTEFIPFR